MTNEPSDPVGNSPFAVWCRQIKAFAKSCRILPGRGYKVKTTPTGTILEIEPGAGGVSASVSIGLYKFVSIPNAQALDYFTAAPVISAGVYGANVSVARQQDLWASTASETAADGTVITYSEQTVTTIGTTYTVKRRAVSVSGLYDSFQMIWPPYKPNELIPVAKVSYTGVASAPSYLELSNRFWAA